MSYSSYSYESGSSSSSGMELSLSSEMSSFAECLLTGDSGSNGTYLALLAILRVFDL